MVKKLLAQCLVIFCFINIACSETTTMGVCNPEDGRFIKGQHYISSDMLTEDQTWNYQNLHKYHSRRAEFYSNEGCLPITPPMTLEEKLDKESMTIDYNR